MRSIATHSYMRKYLDLEREMKPEFRTAVRQARSLFDNQ